MTDDGQMVTDTDGNGMSTKFVAFSFILACAASGCSNAEKEEAMSGADLVKPSGKMKLESPDLKDGGPIPTKHTLYGENVPPEIRIAGVPPGTGSLALVMSDPDAMRVAGKEWVHWVVVDLPPDTTGIPQAGNLPPGARPLKNDFGKEAYGGPRPPAGSGVHHYAFALYAVKAKSLPVKSGASLAEIRSAIRKEALDQAALTGTYEMK